MPADKTAPSTTETAIDPRDARIQELEKKLADVAKASDEKVAELMDALKKAQSRKAQAPTSLPENVVILPGGKQLKIVRTVTAKFALDEVKKGFIEEDIELIVPERG